MESLEDARVKGPALWEAGEFLGLRGEWGLGLLSANSSSASEGAGVKAGKMTISRHYSGLALPLTYLPFRTREY